MTESVNFWKLKKVMESTTLSKSTIYAYIAEDRFPKPVSLGARSVAWVESEINEWKAQQVAMRDEAAA
ncbi:helix-turn-helix transcriptional regulator [Vibrio mangrovi]|uniref:AlpA family transcriptional regulator n=1 Tax=Vibrio mangrovi TaxID=474394 RepID=A0A1Y6IQJ0_9VIBR|nr:AlpA family transcriptional regulator [Vibrio mangrovi]MDW6003314.1 AlpA family transcriptional regulator [Vibrio mangrovi]SMR99896.1 Prophage CP4-57 regulatory protein (AlpA) [Vibrio mangrovi]